MRQLSFIFLMFVSTTSVFGQIPTDGLVGYWPFNGDVKDESCTGNLNFVNNSTQGNDRFGNSNRSIFLNGTNQYLLYASSTSLDNKNFSYSFWVKPETLPADGKSYNIFELGSTSIIGLACSINNNYFNSTGIRITNGNTNSSQLGTETGILPKVGEWIHLVITRNNNNLDLYINNKKEKRIDVQGLTPFYSGKLVDFYIGARKSVNNFFHGNIDDFRIYNKALTVQ